ncbi:MAG TPA: phosphopantetheine-binding protein [Myxococcales bacterium]|nr:phosphopantetheine-binding protein [Myxococcales bacterium]
MSLSEVPAPEGALRSTLDARQAVLDQVRAMLIRQLYLRREPDEIDPDTPLFGSGLGLDSVDAVELLVSLETTSGIRVPDNRAAVNALRTVNSIVDLLLGAPPGSKAGEGSADPEKQLPAVRTSVALSEQPHVRCLRVSGEGAVQLLDRVCPRELFVRDSQMMHTLLLDEAGTTAADVYVCRDDEAFILLVEERPGFSAHDHLRAAAAGPGVEIQPLDGTHQLVSLDGPYAWELMAELVGPHVVGLPYMSFFHGEGWTCFRAGKTGEYGYALLAERARAAELIAKVKELGRPFDLGEVGQDVLDQCALENGFFNVRREGSAGLTPLELQLQWRVSRRKEGFIGAEALARRRQEPAGRRLQCLIAPQPLVAGEAVSVEGKPVGTVLNAGLSPSLGAWAALAILELPFAYPGVDLEMGTRRARTACLPLVINRSLLVSPHRDSYHNRTARELPPLVPGGGRAPV